ncbi:hypothetical protein QBC35DRAFT_475716 [Podospora australis]|uniref:Uncharacterized protein n=1 Tax=Podospora australis TaxID=1536484 RepID=A0AAN6WTQ7_9PEZI|nr:hypothetical protein QBC35DRAFT_475716 [Podospora australis]
MDEIIYIPPFAPWEQSVLAGIDWATSTLNPRGDQHRLLTPLTKREVEDTLAAFQQQLAQSTISPSETARLRAELRSRNGPIIELEEEEDVSYRKQVKREEVFRRVQDVQKLIADSKQYVVPIKLLKSMQADMFKLLAQGWKEPDDRTEEVYMTDFVSFGQWARPEADREGRSAVHLRVRADPGLFFRTAVSPRPDNVTLTTGWDAIHQVLVDEADAFVTAQQGTPLTDYIKTLVRHAGQPPRAYVLTRTSIHHWQEAAARPNPFAIDPRKDFRTLMRKAAETGAHWLGKTCLEVGMRVVVNPCRGIVPEAILDEAEQTIRDIVPRYYPRAEWQEDGRLNVYSWRSLDGVEHLL